jgi:DNA topoisomerase-1
VPAESTSPANTACPENLPPDLHYVDDTHPGYTRALEDGRFAYYDTRGRHIDDAVEIARIDALAIPPAYTEVWICPDPQGHMQATGRDARGRKQYRYHARWRETRDATKFDRMQAFGAALSRIRARVARDLKRRGLAREKVLAAVVRLLDTTLIRVGSAEYARTNRSYGLTTLRKKHLKIQAGALRLRFRGKSGIDHDVTVTDPKVTAIVRRCLDLPGQHLFQYVDEDGERHAVNSSDINRYLRDVTGAEFTAKDYRTWAGSVHALDALRRIRSASAAEAHRQIVDTVRMVAAQLRNTPAVCRRCYIHPAIFDAFEGDRLRALERPPRRDGLKTRERVFAQFLDTLSEMSGSTPGQVVADAAARSGGAASCGGGGTEAAITARRPSRRGAGRAERRASGR